ncbi:quinoprotein relay system zinc metallohydrolase 1 [Paracoccus cavernae]|uniref:quinoprotein relay system zinc metallohydrolase 1 n=1 Tax=Paracoccus cavernae TaxID=1571207 RepID=UPI0035F3A68B
MEKSPKITRRAALGGAAAAAGLLPLAMRPRPARAQSRSYALDPREVASGVWMIEGLREVFSRENGGAIVNIALLETEAGAVVIDTGSTGAMGAAIRSFADDRLGGTALVINTHHHPDHWFGNAAFADIPQIAPAATIAACTQFGSDFAAALYAILGPWMSGTKPHPAGTATQNGPLEIGGRELHLTELAGHTAADLVIADSRTGTLIAGDMLFLERAPSLPDADFSLWLQSLDRIAGAVRPSGTIPGHGPYHRDDAALLMTRAYLEKTRARLALAADLGLTRIEAMSAGPVPEFARLGANPEEYMRSVVRRWPDQEAAALPLVSQG